MKYAKILGLAAMALAALMAFAGPASATTVTAPAGTLYTGTIKASSTNSKLENSSTIGTISCSSSEVEGTVETHGSSVTAEGKISKLTFTSCTGGEPTSPVTTRGSLIVHSLGGGKGTATSTGASVTIHKTLVGTCTFVTNATDIGTVVSGKPAKLEIGSAPIPQKSENIFCPSSATWSGTYTVSSPAELVID